MTEDPTPLRIDLVDSGLHAHEDARGIARPGDCMLVADVQNRTSAPLAFKAQPMEVRDARNRVVGTCEYERALVWEAAENRKRYTTFDPPLAAGEKLRLKLVYRFVDGARAQVKSGALYTYRAPVEAGGAKLVLEAGPFKPEVFPRDGGF